LQRWWLIAVCFALADRAFTFIYFVPAMVKLMSDAALSPSMATAEAMQWGNLNYLRHAIVLIAWLSALKALSLSKGDFCNHKATTWK